MIENHNHRHIKRYKTNEKMSILKLSVLNTKVHITHEK